MSRSNVSSVGGEESPSYSPDVTCWAEPSSIASTLWSFMSFTASAVSRMKVSASEPARALRFKSSKSVLVSSMVAVNPLVVDSMPPVSVCATVALAASCTVNSSATSVLALIGSSNVRVIRPFSMSILKASRLGAVSSSTNVVTVSAAVLSTGVAFSPAKSATKSAVYARNTDSGFTAMRLASLIAFKSAATSDTVNVSRASFGTYSVLTSARNCAPASMSDPESNVISVAENSSLFTGSSNVITRFSLSRSSVDDKTVGPVPSSNTSAACCPFPSVTDVTSRPSVSSSAVAVMVMKVLVAPVARLVFSPSAT